MLQLVKTSEKSNKASINNHVIRPNSLLIELCDESLSPVAEAGDVALVAQYAPPQSGDLVAYQHDGETSVRWWNQIGSKIKLSDAQGNDQIINLADILVLGVVREIRRPIVNGAPPMRKALEIAVSRLPWATSLITAALGYVY
jgi:hypothetical protein